MNKELIRNYKKEFEHWLNSGSVSIFDTACNGWLDCVNPWESSGPQLIKHIVINDRFVEFRKALCEGKVIQYNPFNSSHNRWDDISVLPSFGFDYGIIHYRIKPEEPKFKVGDWVRRKGYSNIFKVNAICSKFLHSATTEHYLIENMELWQPQQGEWCYFWVNEMKFIVAKFECFADNDINQPAFKDVNNFLVTAENVAPFIGTLPC